MMMERNATGSWVSAAGVGGQVGWWGRGVGVPHELTVYDLAGRRVRQLISEPGPAGVYERERDGTDESGQRVLPGTYIYEVKLETDRGTQLGMGTVAVAY